MRNRTKNERMTDDEINKMNRCLGMSRFDKVFVSILYVCFRVASANCACLQGITLRSLASMQALKRG